MNKIHNQDAVAMKQRNNKAEEGKHLKNQRKANAVSSQMKELVMDKHDTTARATLLQLKD